MTDQQQTDNGYASGWRPNAGDRVVGTVVDIAATDGGYGVYPVVTLKTESGEVAVHAFHTVLRRELARRRPKVGDELDITYVGKKSDGGGYGRGYDMYRVRSSGDTQGYDWDRELPDDSRDEKPDEVPIAAGPVPAAQAPAESSMAEKAAESFGDDLPF